MPNTENINKVIQIMERVKANEQSLGRPLFQLKSFLGYQGNWFDERITKFNAPQTENAVLSHCGTTCCVAGWIAVSPEFKHLGLSFTNNGFVNTEEENITEILMTLLGLSEDDIEGLIYNRLDLHSETRYYDKESVDITVDDVIRKLKSLIGEK